MSSNPKTYCYQKPCGPVVQTGFRLEQYYVCSHCKEEVSEALKKIIDDRVSLEEEPKIEMNDDPECYLWKL
jgi:hypothetical protein